MLIPTTKLLQDLLAAATSAASGPVGPLHAPYLMLFSGAPNLTKDTLLTDLTEGVYTGYARLPIGTLGSPYLSSDGSAAQDSGVLQFVPSGTITQTDYITGWALVDAITDGNLLAAEMLPIPKQMALLTDSLSIVVQYEMKPDLSPGQGVIII